MGRVITDIHEITAPLSQIVRVYSAGTLVVQEVVAARVRKDLPRFTAIALVVILLTHLVSFGSFGPILLPLAIGAIGSVWALGTMHLLGLRLTMVSVIAPVLVLTLGSAVRSPPSHPVAPDA